MDPWRKETLNLQVGDTIIWKDEAVEVEGQPALRAPGMKGKVLSLHNGFHLDIAEVAPIPPRAMVQFENGMRLMVDARMKWEHLLESKSRKRPSRGGCDPMVYRVQANSVPLVLST